LRPIGKPKPAAARHKVGIALLGREVLAQKGVDRPVHLIPLVDQVPEEKVAPSGGAWAENPRHHVDALL